MSFPMTKLSLLTVSAVLCAGLLACGESDKDDTDTPKDTGDSGWTPLDTGYYVENYRGDATIVSSSSWDGTEVAYFHGLGPDAYVYCEVTSTATSSTPNSTCSECEFAFDVDLSGSSITSSTGCDLVGINDASVFDGAWGYGYIPDYYYYGAGPYSVVVLDFGGAWYAQGDASFDGSSFSYEFWYDYYYYTYYLP